MIFTVGAAVLYLGNRQEVEKGNLKVITPNDTFMIDALDLEFEQVAGIRINGKGEEKSVEGSGIAIKEIIDMNGITEYSQVTLVADDAYSAVVTAEEVDTEGKAYLLCEEEEFRLVVFGDENSKRSVSNVVEMIVE